MLLDESFKISKRTLLDSNDLTEKSLHEVLAKTLTPGIDYADIYLQYSQSESWALEESLIKRGGFSIDCGVGVRAISDDKTGFAYADDLSISSIADAAFYARNITNCGQVGKLNASSFIKQQKLLYEPINPLLTLTELEKVELLKIVDVEARNFDSRVIQVNADLSGSYNVVLIISSDGSIGTDVRPMVRLNVSVLVEENGKKEYGGYGGGGRVEYSVFIKNELAKQYAREAVRVAIVNLHALPAPAGKMPVVLGCGWPAVMLHEAVGHGLEADFNRKKQSIYFDKLNTKVASTLVSVIDQGNIAGGVRGSLNLDDEATPTQRTLLIENGILCGYMYDKLNAKLMNTKSTGNGRRSSYAQIPIPRMTNTFMAPGSHNPKEIINSVDHGIYAVNFSGGQVDITSGEFVFSTSEAYLINKGKVTTPLKGVTLIGNGPQVLNKITMVGDDLKLDNGVGTCGKSGQGVSVGVGQPTLKISELVVGGMVT